MLVIRMLLYQSALFFLGLEATIEIGAKIMKERACNLVTLVLLMSSVATGKTMVIRKQVVKY